MSFRRFPGPVLMLRHEGQVELGYSISLYMDRPIFIWIYGYSSNVKVKKGKVFRQGMRLGYIQISVLSRL